MLKITKIIFDENSLEADVDLMSGNIKLLCYCHPVECKEDVVKASTKELVAFDVRNIMIDEGDPTAIKTNDGYYSLFLRGIVASKTQIKVNDFMIDIGYMPGDIGTGDTICCECMRIDMRLGR